MPSRVMLLKDHTQHTEGCLITKYKSNQILSSRPVQNAFSHKLLWLIAEASL